MARCSLAALVLCFPLTVVAQEEAPERLSGDEAARQMRLPEGFRATLFAAEPEIVQPMAFTFDDRGRVWVVECLSYPSWKDDGTGGDRVTILEDTDGDGRHDKRTVFYDKGVNVSGIEVGFGGVWLTAVPNLIFIPDANGDDRPDGPPRVLLDGWDLKASHNVVGNLAWGPDGWLYGCNGILSNSRVGKPGTPDNQRVALNCGVWRYHPVRHTFEAYAHGTTNPWGIDWDARGQLFITNCVIKHIFHVVPGAHFERMFGQDINPHSYALLQSCADHQHWAGGHWTTSRGGQGAHGDAGGGHAHSGAMIYLGDNWPEEYRGNAFMVNIHGQRLNRDLLERRGSSYVARHEKDFLFSQDGWFRGLAAKYGPDGGVYMSDWSDIGECHDKVGACDQTSGRIFKISFGSPRPVDEKIANLQKCTDAELSEMDGHPNEWFARHARRILQERAAAGKLVAETTQARKNLLSKAPQKDDSLLRLRTLWTLHVTGQLDEPALLIALSDADEAVRAQAAILSVELNQPKRAVAEKLADLAAEDDSPLVRLHLASALQRIDINQRWPIAKALLSHPEDAADPYLPLMYWYAIEPLAPADPRQAIALLGNSKIPLVRQYLTRRLVAVHEGDGKARASAAWVLDEIVRLLATTPDVAVRLDILRGLEDVYRGRRTVAAPAGWDGFYALLAQSKDAEIRDKAVALAVLFGDKKQLARLEDMVMRRTRADDEQRRRALELLVTKRDPAFGKSVLALLRDPVLRPDAIRALAAYDLPEIPPRLVTVYPTLLPAERQDAIQTLTARPAFAQALLGAIEQGTIPRQDVSALVIRQLQALEDPAVNARLAKVWGDIRPASADKKERIEHFKNLLTTESLQRANLSGGRAVFTKNCATCHRLFDEGSRIGPELTGAQRHNLDYVLDNVLDPSAIVPRDYKVNIFRLASGRIVQGVILEETPHALAVQTQNEVVRVPAGEVEARKESTLSMMPEGLFDRLSPEEIRDLVAYLASPQQVPLPDSSPSQPPAGEPPQP